VTSVLSSNKIPVKAWKYITQCSLCIRQSCYTARKGARNDGRQDIGAIRGLGGTGDVTILAAAGRVELVPFAQVGTRIGGAIAVALALIAPSRSRPF
jgi:hypothetical protein